MDNFNIKLLLVEDNRADAVILEELLLETPTLTVDFTSVQRLSEALKRLATQKFDIIFLDLSLPDAQELEALTQIQQQNSTLPIIILTGLDNEEIATKAMRQGVQDYLVKGEVDSHTLVRAIRYAIERKRTTETLRLQAERERLLGFVSQRIRQTLNLEEILHTTVTEVRHLLGSDRVLIYQFEPDWNGKVVAESVAQDVLALYGCKVEDACFREIYLTQYQLGRVRAIDNVYQNGLSPCHINLLASFQVQANLVVPILIHEPQITQPRANYLWGLLIAHQCRGPRSWQLWETNLLMSIANQVGIALQQSQLYRQVQQLNTHLENLVEERTAQLQQAHDQLKQSLEFEALLKRITDKVRDSLDETQILPTAVRELALGLNAQSCQAALYDLERGTATIRYGYAHSRVGWLGQVVFVSDFLDVYHQLIAGKACQFCEVYPIRSRCQDVILACPLIDDQGILGDLWLFKPFHQEFNEIEIRLVQQVANQCAVALRQARLYQAAQVQVIELERLNALKNDFLCTISHELRTPVANIQMALSILELALTSKNNLKSDPLYKSHHNSQTTDSVYAPLSGSNLTIYQYLQMIKDECDREMNLINDLLDLQRLNAGVHPIELITIDIQNWIPHLIEPFMQRVQKNQQILVVDIVPELPAVVCDLSCLTRILNELLTNACKYTPSGGTITLKVSTEDSTLRFQVSNSGVEIPEDELNRIFDNFYRIPSDDPWKQEGIGLGLALVQKLTNHLGGSIQVTSYYNQTCFTVELPLLKETEMERLT
jgi:signal transduction histidine kinase/DNA-binding NarL/FixJ family response regulator